MEFNCENIFLIYISFNAWDKTKTNKVVRGDPRFLKQYLQVINRPGVAGAVL